MTVMLNYPAYPPPVHGGSAPLTQYLEYSNEHKSEDFSYLLSLSSSAIFLQIYFIPYYEMKFFKTYLHTNSTLQTSTPESWNTSLNL